MILFYLRHHSVENSVAKLLLEWVVLVSAQPQVDRTAVLSKNSQESLLEILSSVKMQHIRLITKWIKISSKNEKKLKNNFLISSKVGFFAYFDGQIISKHNSIIISISMEEECRRPESQSILAKVEHRVLKYQQPDIVKQFAQSQLVDRLKNIHTILYGPILVAVGVDP